MMQKQQKRRSRHRRKLDWSNVAIGSGVRPERKYVDELTEAANDKFTGQEEVKAGLGKKRNEGARQDTRKVRRHVRNDDSGRRRKKRVCGQEKMKGKGLGKLGSMSG